MYTLFIRIFIRTYIIYRYILQDEFDNLDANETEMERLSNDELEHTDDSKSASVTHKKAYPVAAPRKAVAST